LALAVLSFGRLLRIDFHAENQTALTLLGDYRYTPASDLNFDCARWAGAGALSWQVESIALTP
jgi:hypothetical protein